MLHGHTPFSHCREERELKYHIVRPLAESAFRKDIHPSFKYLIAKLMEVDEARRPAITDIAKDPVLDSLREMLKPKESGKRKFSFNDRVPISDLFHKKTEANLQIAVLPANQQVNKSVDIPSQQRHQTNQFALKPPPIKLTFAQYPQETQYSQGKLPADFTMPLSSKFQRSSQYWEGESTKTN